MKNSRVIHRNLGAPVPGLVVNNGIVLMETINAKRKEGLPVLQAAFEASKIRTRPILMSALTTICAMAPIALGWGEGNQLRSPLAMAVIGGLGSSTLFTLLVLPCLYILSTRLLERRSAPVA